MGLSEHFHFRRKDSKPIALSFRQGEELVDLLDRAEETAHAGKNVTFSYKGHEFRQSHGQAELPIPVSQDTPNDITQELWWTQTVVRYKNAGWPRAYGIGEWNQTKPFDPSAGSSLVGTLLEAERRSHTGNPAFFRWEDVNAHETHTVQVRFDQGNILYEGVAPAFARTLTTISSATHRLLAKEQAQQRK